MSARASRYVVPSAGADIEVLVTPAPAPVGRFVVIVHGYGGSASALLPLAKRFSIAGYHAAAMSMRGFGGSTGTDDLGLQQPDDVVAVARWLRDEQAAARVYALGISQGGQVALLAAAAGAPLDAIVAWAPVTDVARWRDTTTFAGIPEYVEARCTDGRYDERSPVHAAHRIRPPVLLVHGDADRRVPTEQSVSLHKAVVAAGGRSRLVLLAGVEHRDAASGPSSFDHSLAFLNEVDAHRTPD